MPGNMSLEKSSFSDKQTDRLLLAVLIAFTLFVRLYFLQMINVGPDEIDYWFSAKRLIGPGAYPDLMHRTIRWAIILPTAFFQLLLGMHPLVYYVVPVFNSLVQTVLLFLLGKHLFGRGVSFYAVLLFTAWPYMWRTGSQIRPAVFSLTYVLAALCLLFFYLEHAQDDSRRSRLCFVGSVLALFLAYESKITNLYFLPGILIVLLLRHRRMGPAIRYGLYLLGLYVIEHVAYFVAVGDPLGRLGIIAKNHLASSYADKLPKSFWGLFERYTIYLEFPWYLLLIAFVAASIYLLAKKKPWIRELTVLHASFFFFLTFMVKSIKPIVPVEAFLDRYFIACLPTMSLVIVYALHELLPLSIVGELNRRGVLISLTAGLSVVMLLITALPMPKSIERFYTPLQRIHDHPIAKTFEFQHLIASAIEENIPILSVDTRKPLDTANRVFFDDPKKGRWARPIGKLEIEGHVVYYLDGIGNVPFAFDVQEGSTNVLWCDRFNFDMTMLKLREIPNLGDIYE